MFALSKKIFLATILTLVILTTGAWQSDQVVLAKSRNADIPETPLYPGLTWSDPSVSVQDIRININGDLISLSGERYEAREQSTAGVPQQDVLNYYSNEELAKSGWASHDTVEIAGGVRHVFYHESGVYLSVDFIPCPGVSSTLCLAVWKSEQIDPVSALPEVPDPGNVTTTASTFGKNAPANGATNLNPASVALSWGAYSPAPDKYIYCVQEGSACAEGDPDWTTTFNTSVTLTNFGYNKTYYWQVKAITCVTCVPKEGVYADNGVAWTFKTKQATQAVIIGNAGVAGAVLSYVDGTSKTATADGSGNYSITVPINWSGTITPAKSGYLFSPQDASFVNLTALQTIQNFNAVPAYTISGNAGLAGVTLSYTDGTLQTVVSNGNGNYSIVVPSNWSGTVTPSKTGFIFSPTSRNYSNVSNNRTAQDYKALVTISGNAGVAGATLSYMDGTLKTVTANGSGEYSLHVPYDWTGTVTPSKTGFAFTPVSRSYSSLHSNQTLQNYTAIDDPIVLSIVRVNDNPTAASSVDFTVKFSETVTGVDTGDFTLTTTGLTGTSITQLSGSGATYVVKVNTGSGTGTIRLDVLDDDTIVDGAGNLLGGTGDDNGNFTTGEIYDLVNFVTTPFETQGARDGWILESSETSNQGGSMNDISTFLYVGDHAQNKQYKSILSFDTSSLPDGAVVTKVQVKIKVQGFIGGNMFTPTKTLGNLLMDIRQPHFGTNANVAITDFDSAASKNGVGVLTSAPATGWYTVTLKTTSFPFVNLAGTTQLRLRFTKDDNDDLNADYLKIFSGDALAASRPQLIVEYYVP